MKLLKENNGDKEDMSMWESDYDDDLYESKISDINDLKKKLYEAIDDVLRNFKPTSTLKENTISNDIINKEQPKQTQSMLGNIQWWDEPLNNDSSSKNNIDLYTNDINVDDEM